VDVLRRGRRWRDRPRHLGYGSGGTCWRRLRRWQALGVWDAGHHTVLNWLGLLDAITWDRASVDRTSIRATRGGEATGPSPTDRGTPGSTYHLLVDRQGVPLAVGPSGANVHDAKRLAPLVDAVPRSCTGTTATTTPSSGGRCAGAAARRGSPAAASRRVSGVGGIAGRWSARSPGSSRSAG
jgi:transposase